MKNTTMNSNSVDLKKEKFNRNFKETSKQFGRAIKLWLNPDEKVKIMIVNGRADERKMVEDGWKIKYNEMIERAARDKSYAIQEKEAKIDSLKKTIEERDLRLKNVEEIFNYCWEQTKANMNLASDLRVQVWRAQKNQTDTYQAITEIVDRAHDYMGSLEKKESRFKELLGWKGL